MGIGGEGKAGVLKGREKEVSKGEGTVANRMAEELHPNDKILATPLSLCEIQPRSFS